MLIPDWSYSGDDPGLRLFTLANEKLPTVHAGRPFLYEVGCSDTDWLERVRQLHPTWYASGVDWRKQAARSGVDCGDVLTIPLPHAHVYLGLSSIEHVGLGHYDGDPVDYYGDVKAVQRMRDHLHTNGYIYLDVPYAPEGYWVHGTKCRIYDDRALWDRFGPHEVLGYTGPDVAGWIAKPSTNLKGQRPYYYVALLITQRLSEKGTCRNHPSRRPSMSR